MQLGLHRGVVAALFMSGTAFAAMALFNAIGPKCRFMEGAGFFWTTFPPTALLACVLGAVLAGRGWRWRTILPMLPGVLVLSLIHDLMQVLMGPQVVDLLVGKPLALDIRAGMNVPLLHLYQRIMMLGLSWTLWNLALWRHGRRHAGLDPDHRDRQRARAFRSGLGAFVLLSVAVAAGSHVGLGWGRGAIHSHLSGELRTEHFIIRYSPHGTAALHVPGIARDAEWHWHYLTSRWGVKPEGPVRLYLFDSAYDQGLYTTTRAPHTLFDEIYLNYYSALSSTLQHELVHAIHYDLDPSVKVLMSRGVIEGLAMAWQHDYALLPEAHRKQAGALRGGTLPSATAFMSVLGFQKVKEHNAYEASGSFIGFLILEHGFDRFREFQSSMNYHKVYQRDLHELDLEWRGFLESVPVDMETQVAARDSFDPTLWPGYTEQCCPKLGDREEQPELIAGRMWRNEDWSGALEIFQDLYAERETPRLAYQVSQCMRRLGLNREAIAVLDKLLARSDLDPAERFRLLRAKIPCLLAEEDWPELEKALDARAAIENSPPPYWTSVESCLRRPDLRTTVAKALSTYDWYLKRRLLDDLQKQYPGDPAVRFIHLVNMTERFFSNRSLVVSEHERAVCLELLERGENSPELMEQLAPVLIDFLDKVIRLGEYDLATDIT